MRTAPFFSIFVGSFLTVIKMKSFRFLIVLLPLSVLISCVNNDGPVVDKVIKPVDFSDVHIEDGFWSTRLDRHKTATIPICIDQIENQTSRMKNFEAAATGEGEHKGFFFDDSDVYKALEGMAYSLIQHPDAELEAKCDEWIAKIAAAQQENGYIDTYFTLVRPQDEWTDMDKHELYCTGHMIEAAIAYYKATGKMSLVDVAEKMVAHAMTVIGPEGKHWVPGHEEIELALVKLYQLTGKKEYVDFAGWLLEQRGHGYGVYGDGSEEVDDFWLTYYQDKVPVSELTDICGHAVRAMYLYCGMADVATYTGNQAYLDALDRLWDDVVLRNMYITGGIGQSASNEGFTEDYDLPNLSAYCETCASVGMILWNSRMNQLTGDAKYADVVERCLYNGALAGVSLSGDRFFYVNPLESLGNHHRRAWYGCACCPSQICRFLPSIGSYIYGTSDDALYVNLYIGSDASFKAGGRQFAISQKTSYPWDGEVTITFGKSTRSDLMLRIPDWCKSVSFTVGGEPATPEIEGGYARLKGSWKKGDVVIMNMDMPVRMDSADPRVKDDEGKRAVCRGPVVYCAEETDNPVFDDVVLAEKTSFTHTFEADVLDGIETITTSEGFRLIPYYAWDNREAGRMKVWLDLK